MDLTSYLGECLEHYGLASSYANPSLVLRMEVIMQIRCENGGKYANEARENGGKYANEGGLLKIFFEAEVSVPPPKMRRFCLGK